MEDECWNVELQDAIFHEDVVAHDDVGALCFNLEWWKKEYIDRYIPPMLQPAMLQPAMLMLELCIYIDMFVTYV